MAKEISPKKKTIKKSSEAKKRKEPKAKKAEKKPIEAEPKVVVPAVTETGVSGEELSEAEFQELMPKDKRPDRYFEAVGRRKTAIARVRLFTRSGDFVINDKLYGQYFPTLELQRIAEDALQKMKLFGRFRVSVKVSGGGVHAQAEALRHGLARCLVKFNPDFRKRLKRAGFLKRDPRMKERKKFGLKKARRAPQWAKR